MELSEQSKANSKKIEIETFSFYPLSNYIENTDGHFFGVEKKANLTDNVQMLIYGKNMIHAFGCF